MIYPFNINMNYIKFKNTPDFRVTITNVNKKPYISIYLTGDLMDLMGWEYNSRVNILYDNKKSFSIEQATDDEDSHALFILRNKKLKSVISKIQFSASSVINKNNFEDINNINLISYTVEKEKIFFTLG